MEALRQDLAGIFGAPQFDRMLWAVLVQSTPSSQPWFSLNASKLVMPASNMKLLTLAAAVEMFGWDHTFETKLVSSGTLEEGVLRGDLVVVGSGDPSISERSDRPGLFQSWAQQLWDLGIRRIEGRIVGDDDAFDDQGLGPGWAWDNLPYGFSAPVGALEYNEGSADLAVKAGDAPGEPVAIQVRPDGSGLEVENRLMTIAENGAGILTLRRLPGSPRLEVAGQIPAKAPEFVRTASVDNPTTFFVRALQGALTARGIEVAGGEAIDIDSLARKPDRAAARVLVTHRSPPLGELATSMMKVSQNQYAELLLKALAAREGTGTTEAGGRMVREILRTWGIPDDSFIVSDGSGLSRHNYVTAEALVIILQRLHEDQKHAAFLATLPVAGRDGTLARRLAGTPAEGNVRAKTGTIDNARAISGYVTTKDGEILVFSMIANNFSGPPSAIDQAADQALIRLASFSRNATQ